jgi:hypothetical protein
MIEAYKLLRVRRDGTLGSLFINRNQVIEPGKWLKAESYPTEGFAFRPGWHCTHKRSAPHLSKKGRVWKKVLIKNYSIIERPKAQGGVWYLARWMKLEK